MAGEEAAGAASWIEQDFAGGWIDAVRHEGGNGGPTQLQRAVEASPPLHHKFNLGFF
jgi:hypothetical protein